MFAFMHLTWVEVVVGIIAVSFLCRTAKRGPGSTCRRRGWFPWKIVILAVLATVAVRHFSERPPKPAKDVAPPNRDPIHAFEPRDRRKPFPPVKDKDLWALRRAKPNASHAAEDLTVEARPTPRPQPAPALPQDQLDPPPAPLGDGPLESPYIPSDISRTIAEAKALAHRAAAEAKQFYARTSRDAVALAVFGATRNKAGQVATTPESTAPESSAAATAPAETPPRAPTSEPPADDIASSTTAGPSTTESAPVAQTPPTAPATPALLPKADVAGQAPPDWINAAPGRDGDTYYTTLTVGPWKSAQECEEELSPRLAEAVSKYVDNYLGAGASKTFDIPLSYIHDHIIRDRYVQEFESETAAVNTMVNLHVRLAFDGRTRAQLKRMYREAQVESRLLEVAGGAAAVLLVLATVFGYLKLDTLTRGYYTRRLQLAAAVVILTTMAAVGAAFADATHKFGRSPASWRTRSSVGVRPEALPAEGSENLIRAPLHERDPI
jgi:hypothetical protein